MVWDIRFLSDFCFPHITRVLEKSYPIFMANINNAEMLLRLFPMVGGHPNQIWWLLAIGSSALALVSLAGCILPNHSWGVNGNTEYIHQPYISLEIQPFASVGVSTNLQGSDATRHCSSATTLFGAASITGRRHLWGMEGPIRCGQQRMVAPSGKSALGMKSQVSS